MPGSDIFRNLNSSESTLNQCWIDSEDSRIIQTDSEIFGNHLFGFILVQAPYNGFRQIQLCFRKIQNDLGIIQKLSFMRASVQSASPGR